MIRYGKTLLYTFLCLTFFVCMFVELFQISFSQEDTDPIKISYATIKEGDYETYENATYGIKFEYSKYWLERELPETSIQNHAIQSAWC
jgi:hypothetical protein